MEQVNTRAALLEAVRDQRQEIERVIAEAGEERMEQPGSFGEWTFKDLIAHLTSWRTTMVARLEAGLSGKEPVFPWPPHLDENQDTDEINHWFFETNRDKPLADILRESRETFERVERAIAALPEDDLFVPGRFPWMGDYSLGLGPACVPARGEGHFHEEHEPEIRAWLAQG